MRPYLILGFAIGIALSQADFAKAADLISQNETAAAATTTEAAAPSNAAVTNPSEFVTKAMIGGMFEIESGKLAVQKGQSDGVKKFGQQMIDDHTKAGDELKKQATAANVPSQSPPALDPPHQQMLDQLNQAQGPAFDQAFLQAQTKAHDEAIMLFEGFVNTGDNAQLKQFAATTLPTLQKHRSDLDEISKAQTQ